MNKNEKVGVLLDCVLQRDTNEAYFDFVDELNTDYLPVLNLLQNAESRPATTSVLVREVSCQETLVLGNFPKLPPYYIERTSRVSFYCFCGGKSIIVSFNYF